MKCETCRYWHVVPPEDWVAHPVDPDTCEPMAFPFEVRRCASPKLLFYERPVSESHAALVDGSHFTAKLLTGPEFGCVNHEPLQGAS